MPARSLTLGTLSLAAALGAMAEVDPKIDALVDAQTSHLQFAVHCGDADASRVDWEFTARLQNADMPEVYRALNEMIVTVVAEPRPKDCEARLAEASDAVAEAKKDVFP